MCYRVGWKENSKYINIIEDLACLLISPHRSLTPCFHSVPFLGDHGGSTLLPPTVTNEFPEYGTMEEGGEGLRASLAVDAKSPPCRLPGQQAAHLLAAQDSMLGTITEGPNDAPQCHAQEQSLQPIDSLISALKATEARIASGTFQTTKVLDKDANFSVHRVDNELRTASHKPQRAHRTFPAGPGKSPDIPLSVDVPTEEDFSLHIQEDLTELLPEEAQAQLSQITNYRRQGPLHVPESACPVSSGPAGSHDPADRVGAVKDERSALGGERPGGRDRGGSMGRQGRIKHVEFQGVEILWTGEEAESRPPVGFETSPERTASPVSKEFARGPSHSNPTAAGVRISSTHGTGGVWGDTCKAPSSRPGTSLGSLSPVPRGESGEDDVFLRGSKEHLEENFDIQGDKER